MSALRFRPWKLLAAALLAAFCLLTPASAAEDGGYVYCLAQEDFSNEPIDGIFVLSVPSAQIGRILCGNRVICAGDVLPVQTLDQLVLNSCCRTDAVAELTYLPLQDGHVGKQECVRITLQAGKAGIPIAQELTIETYKNIANDGQCKASYEGGTVTYQIVDMPKLGSVTLEKDGRFLYTPEQNKVGEDVFTYTATDENGNISAPASVHILIRKPSSQITYADMEGDPDAFEALWLANQEIFQGSMMGSTTCFCPNQSVSRGEFLVLAMNALDVAPAQGELSSGFCDEADAASWMQPYLVGAMRHGIVHGIPTDHGLAFYPNQAITHAEAAIIVQNILKLPRMDVSVVSNTLDMDVAPAWAEDAIEVLMQHDLPIGSGGLETMNRIDAATLLYQANTLLHQK